MSAATPKQLEILRRMVPGSKHTVAEMLPGVPSRHCRLALRRLLCKGLVQLDGCKIGSGERVLVNAYRLTETGAAQRARSVSPEQARAALAAGDRVEALRMCAEAMAGELPPDEVAEVVDVLDEIRRR